MRITFDQGVSEMADFQPTKQTIEDLLLGPEYYLIPRFQRPYSWDKANLEDFWRDVVYDNKVGYFIGPMVAWSEKNSSVRRLVDGQQRMTTIAIMFAVIRDAFNTLGQDNLAKGVNRYLEKADRDNVLNYTLKSEVQTSFLDRGIFSNPPELDLLPGGEEERALYQAVSQIRKLVENEVEKRSAPLDWLTELRDKLLGLEVIWIDNSSEDAAYILFETLNSRGRDLEVVDLLKNLLFSKLRGSGNPRADPVRDTWNAMRETIEGAGSAQLEVNRFILHWWLSREDYVAQRKLFRAIKSSVKSKTQANAMLQRLAVDAVYYRYALDPDYRVWPPEEARVKQSLEALADFRIIQPAPLLLSLLRARFGARPQLKAAGLRVAMQTVERFHFKYTVISQLSSSGGISEMYAKAAREICNAQDSDRRSMAIRDIRTKLEERQPTKDQFVSDFIVRFVFTDKSTRDAKIVRYVLRELLRTLQPATGLDLLTIEHIMPQSAVKNGLASEEMVGSIGNLILVSNDLNTRLDNKEFAAKRAILAAEGAPYDVGGVLNTTTWGQAEIVARARLLGEVAYDVVWKLPV
jgi:hypothetical protein